MRVLIRSQQVSRRILGEQRVHYPLAVRARETMSKAAGGRRSGVRRRRHHAAPSPRPLIVQGARENAAQKPRGRTLRTMLPVAAMVLFAGGAIGLFVALSPGPAALPKGGPSLPKDPQAEVALTGFPGALGVGGAPASPGGAPVVAAASRPAPPVKFLHSVRISRYTVKPGDTVSGIAHAFGVSDETLISFNGIDDVRILAAGTVLKVPNMNGVLYSVRRGDTLEGIASSYGVKLSTVLDANNLTSSIIYPSQDLFLPNAHMSSFAYRKALGTLFIYPTNGVITSPFGMRHDPFTGIVTFHNGVDLANAMGTPVHAAMAGRVAYLGVNRGYGRFILIDHGGGYQTLYAHLLKWLVTRGQYVRTGQEIGQMGDTGYSTGPHLHFTIYKNGVPVNPLDYLSRR